MAEVSRIICWLRLRVALESQARAALPNRRVLTLRVGPLLLAEPLLPRQGVDLRPSFPKLCLTVACQSEKEPALKESIKEAVLRNLDPWLMVAGKGRSGL